MESLEGLCVKPKSFSSLFFPVLTFLFFDDWRVIASQADGTRIKASDGRRKILLMTGLEILTLRTVIMHMQGADIPMSVFIMR